MSRHLLHRHDTDVDDDTQVQDTQSHDSLFTTTRQEVAQQRFGGTNPGAAFFGWLVAIGMTILLAGIVGAAAAAIGENADLTRDDIEGNGNFGIGAVALLIVVLVIGYYCGGYVAGRMSRFDGATQGFAVWLIGLLVTLLAVGAGALFGSQYDVQQRVDLPRAPFSDSELTVGGVVAGLLVLAITLMAAMAGGRIGHRYHDKVDRIAGRTVVVD
jgi:amino acid transporter